MELKGTRARKGTSGALQLMCLHRMALPLPVGREADCAAHLLSCCSLGHLLSCLQGFTAGHCMHQTQPWV